MQLSSLTHNFCVCYIIPLVCTQAVMPPLTENTLAPHPLVGIVSSLTLFSIGNKIPKTGLFIRKRGLLGSQFWMLGGLKAWHWHLLSVQGWYHW